MLKQSDIYENTVNGGFKMSKSKEQLKELAKSLTIEDAEQLLAMVAVNNLEGCSVAEYNFKMVGNLVETSITITGIEFSRTVRGQYVNLTGSYLNE